MSFLFYQSNFGGRTGLFTGSIWNVADDWSSYTRLSLPPSVSAIFRPPSIGNWGNRQYVVGGHTQNLVIDEESGCSAQGILPPPPPSVSAGAGTTPQIGYLRYFDDITGERSPLSGGTVFTGNTTRAWATLPTEVSGERLVLDGTATYSVVGGVGTFAGDRTSWGFLRLGDRVANAADLTHWARIVTITSDSSMTVDDAAMVVGAGQTLVVKTRSRVSHLELWLAVSVALPRFVMRVPLGTPSVSESVPTLSLGEAFIDYYKSMPLGSMNCFYGDRQFIAGVEGFRDTVFASLIGFPERYGGLSFRTMYNEPVVGLLRYRGYIIVLCPNSSYKIQGYTEDDYVRDVLEPEIGGLGHHGNRVANGIAFIPSRKGIQVFNGAFHEGLPTRSAEWDAIYKRFPNSYQFGAGAVNPTDKTYQFTPLAVWDSFGGLLADFITPADTGNTFAHSWVGAYDVVNADPNQLRAAEWTSDSIVSPGGYLLTSSFYLVPSGQHVGSFIRADTNGYVYEEVGDATGSDPPQWDAIVVPAHMLMGDPGGGLREGKQLIRLWSYVIAEQDPWRVSVWPGDEYAYPFSWVARGYEWAFALNNPTNYVLPGYKDDVAASAFSQAIAAFFYKGTAATELIYQMKSVHHHKVDGGPVSGRGFSFEFRFLAPLRTVQFIGLGGEWGPGEATRPVWVARVPPV